jgi:hypothetical protein
METLPLGRTTLPTAMTYPRSLLRIEPLGSEAALDARHCMQTSENSSSRHFGE